MVKSDRFRAIITTHYGSDGSDRLVGADRKYDSGYSRIYRFFGENRIEPSLVELQHKADAFQFNDERIMNFANKCERKLREEGRLKDGPDVVSLVTAGLESDPKAITIQRASYGQFAGSCFFLDILDPIFGERGDLRTYYLATRKTAENTDNPLAACFGVSALVLIEEENQRFMLRTRRSAKLATLTGTYGASVAGVVDYHSGFENLNDLIEVSLSQEVNEEINLADDEYQIIPLAYSHELFRGEHPQLFCLVRCSLSRKQLSERLDNIDEAAKEFDRFDFPQMNDGRLADVSLIESFNFEGKMSYYLAEEYLALSGSL